MLRILLLLLSLACGFAIGTGAALVSGAPDGDSARRTAGESAPATEADLAEATEGSGNVPTDREGDRLHGSVPLGRQIIVPVVRGRSTEALVLFDLALDLPEERAEAAKTLGPHLRDAFLRDLLELSYTGAFDETYTDARVLDEIRRRLLSSARSIVGREVEAVLILDVLRQEL